MRSRTLVILLGLFLLGNACWSQEPSLRKLYTVRDTGKGIMVKVDAKEYGPYEEVSSTPFFDESGKNWGMILRRPDGRFVALVNGAEKGPLPASYEFCSDISVSPDGSSWSMRADLGGNLPERALRVVNGKEYGPFGFTGEFSWSPAGAPGQGGSGAGADNTQRASSEDAGAPAGWYFRADSRDGQMIWTNDKKYGPYMDTRDFAFDPKGTRLAFQFRNRDGGGVWVNGKEYGPYNDSRILRGPDGSFFGWTDSLRNGSQEITVGDKKYGPYAYVDGRLYVSGDQKRWLLMVVKNNAAYLLSNEGEEQMERLEVVPLKEGFLYHRNKGPAQYVVTDKGQFGPYENLRDFMVIPDQSTWGLSYWKGDTNSPQTPWIVINGKEYPGENLRYQHAPPGSAGAAAGTASGAGYFSWTAIADDGSAAYTRFQKDLSTKTIYMVKKSDSGITISSGGKDLGQYERILGEPAVGTDGKNWGLLASNGGGMVTVVINGAEAGSFGPYARSEGFTMNDAGTVWSFSAMKEDTPDGSRLRLLNGTEYGPFEVDVPPAYAPDGSGWFFGTAAAGKRGQAYLYFNGKKFGPFQSLDEDKVFDFAKGRFALKENAPEGAFVWINDKRFGPYRDVQILRTGARNMDSFAGLFGFIGLLKNGSQELCVDGDRTYGPFASVGQGNWYISADGKTWIMAERKQGADRDTMLMNGAEIATNGWDVRPTRTGYAMLIRKNGRDYFTTEEKTYGPYEGIRSWFVSSDGGMWAGEAMQTKGNSRFSVIVVNGKEYPGERLRYTNTAAGESFTWISYDQDGSGTLSTIKVR